MNPYLLPVLKLGPTVIERLIRQIDPSKLDQPSHPGRFSPREIVAHLADWEPILQQRIRQTVESPGSMLQVFDEGEMAVAHNYGASDIEDQLRVFAEARKANVAYLETLSEDDWKKSSLHPERGELTAREQAFTEIGHDMYHVEQLGTFLR